MLDRISDFSGAKKGAKRKTDLFLKESGREGKTVQRVLPMAALSFFVASIMRLI